MSVQEPEPPHVDSVEVQVRELITFLDASPAVLWAGKGGAKQRALEWLASRRMPWPTPATGQVIRLREDDARARLASYRAELEAVRSARSEYEIESDIDAMLFLLGEDAGDSA